MADHELIGAVLVFHGLGSGRAQPHSLGKLAPNVTIINILVGLRVEDGKFPPAIRGTDP